jgi:hypothetical protein
MAGLHAPYRRFADILADACARLGADAVRYSFIEAETSTGDRRLMAYSVEKLCFEDTTCASDPLERSQFLAHGGVLPTRHLSPTSRY